MRNDDAVMSHVPMISVVVPVYNEQEALPRLVEAVTSALAGESAWELVLVDDGSEDRTPEVAREAARRDARVRLVQLARNYGQTAAMQAGFDAAHGEVVVSMDGDLQNDPRDIPVLVRKLGEGYDLVVGFRQRRQDKLITRKVPSWIANRLIYLMSGVYIRDNGCSLKAYRKQLLDRLSLYSDQHRFIPAVAVSTAGARVAEVPVRHHARRFGQSKYGLSRVGKVLADLLTVVMIRSFRERPLAMFALGASAAAVIGVLFGVAGVFAYLNFRVHKAQAVVLPTSGLIWMGLAFYLMMLGFIAEVAVRTVRGGGDHLPLLHRLRRGTER